jgi:hypothetical protein
MRALMPVLIPVLSALIAGPAMAQPPPLGLQGGLLLQQQQQAQFLQQQEASRQQLIQQQNQLMSLQAQLQTQQALANIQAQASVPQLPLPDVTPGRALPSFDTSQLATIPDNVLADSNQRVLDAVGRQP